jgi:hypothetical protein
MAGAIGLLRSVTLGDSHFGGRHAQLGAVIHEKTQISATVEITAKSPNLRVMGRVTHIASKPLKSLKPVHQNRRGSSHETFSEMHLQFLETSRNVFSHTCARK